MSYKLLIRKLPILRLKIMLTFISSVANIEIYSNDSDLANIANGVILP